MKLLDLTLAEFEETDSDLITAFVPIGWIAEHGVDAIADFIRSEAQPLDLVSPDENLEPGQRINPDYDPNDWDNWRVRIRPKDGYTCHDLQGYWVNAKDVPLPPHLEGFAMMLSTQVDTITHYYIFPTCPNHTDKVIEL